jgi:hypothetical protein
VKGPSPHSVPIRLDPERSRFLFSPHSVPLEFLPVPGGAGSAPRNLESLSRMRARPQEPGRNPAGTRRGLASPPSRLGVRRYHAFDRCGVPPWQSGSGSRPSPIQRRETAPERDAFRGENPGSLRGVRVRRFVRLRQMLSATRSESTRPAARGSRSTRCRRGIRTSRPRYLRRRLPRYLRRRLRGCLAERSGEARERLGQVGRTHGCHSLDRRTMFLRRTPRWSEQLLSSSG